MGQVGGANRGDPVGELGVEYFVPEDIYEQYTGPDGHGQDHEPSA